MNPRRAAGLLLATLACAAFSGLAFFALLAVWGVAFAPWVRLDSASFVIIVALALSSALTAVAWRAYFRSRGKRIAGSGNFATETRRARRRQG